MDPVDGWLTGPGIFIISFGALWVMSGLNLYWENIAYAIALSLIAAIYFTRPSAKQIHNIGSIFLNAFIGIAFTTLLSYIYRRDVYVPDIGAFLLGAAWGNIVVSLAYILSRNNRSH